MEHEKNKSWVVWQSGMKFEATTTTGHHLVLDTLPPGGTDSGPKPIELVLTALGGCTAMDVLSILQKMREPIEGLSVEVEGTRAAVHPMSYTDITMVYHVQGNVEPASLERAIELSRRKYCGVYAMLKHSAQIGTRYEIERGEMPEPEIVFGPDAVVEREHVAFALP